MQRRTRTSMVAAAAALLAGAGIQSFGQAPGTAGTAGAPGAANDPVQGRLQRMQQELDNLHRENQAMKDQIDDLHAKSDDNWLTQERAKEIRGLVEDVLADSDSRASLLQSGVMAGWVDHFYLADPNGRFKLILAGQEQIRWIFNHHDLTPVGGQTPDGRHDRHGFENTRSRLTFSGYVFNESFEYLIRGDFFGNRGASGFFNLLDSWIRYIINDEWSVRAGQFKLPFNREELVSDEYQLAVERSLVNEELSLRRSQGVELEYHDSVNALSIAYSDGASAAFLGNPQVNTAWSARGNDYAVAARYERLAAGTWGQFVDFTSPATDQFGMLLGIGAQVQRGENNVSAGTREQGSFGLTGDLSLEFGGANAFLSFTHQYVDNAPGPVLKLYGAVAQIGVYVTPKWELFVRGEHMWVDGIDLRDLTVITAGFNYYIEGHDLKWTSDIGIGLSPVESFFASDLAGYRSDVTTINQFPFPPRTVTSNHQLVFRTQFQLLF